MQRDADGDRRDRMDRLPQRFADRGDVIAA